MSFSVLSKRRLSHLLLSLGKWLSEAQTEFSSQRMDGKHIFSNGIYRVYWTISEADCKNNALSLRDLTTTCHALCHVLQQCGKTSCALILGAQKIMAAKQST